MSVLAALCAFVVGGWSRPTAQVAANALLVARHDTAVRDLLDAPEVSMIRQHSADTCLAAARKS